MNATLPQSLEIDGLTCVQCFRSHNYAIYQSYTTTTPPSDEPIRSRGGEITGANLFHLFRIERTPAEQLGERIGSYTSLQAAMNEATRLT